MSNLPDFDTFRLTLSHLDFQDLSNLRIALLEDLRNNPNPNIEHYINILDEYMASLLLTATNAPKQTIRKTFKRR